MSRAARKSTHERIYESLKMIMGRKPYSTISVTEVAEEAGISRMTFYRHFSSLDDVLLAHSSRILSAIGDDIRSGTFHDAYEFWDKLYTELNCSGLIGNMQSAGLAEEFFQRFEDLFLDVFSTVLGRDMSIPANRVRMEFAMGGLIGLLHYSASPDTIISREDIQSFLRDMSRRG